MSENKVTLTESELRDLLIRSAKKMYEDSIEKSLTQSAKELAKEICKKNPEACSDSPKSSKKKKYTKETLKGKRVPALREIASKMGVSLGSGYKKKEEIIKSILRKQRKDARASSAKSKASSEKPKKEETVKESPKKEKSVEEPRSPKGKEEETIELEFENSEVSGESEDEPLDLDEAKKFLEENLVDETDVTKEDFAKFLVIEKKGKVKMDNPAAVAKASGLTENIVQSIIKNRTSLEKKYPTLVKKKKKDIFARRR